MINQDVKIRSFIDFLNKKDEKTKKVYRNVFKHYDIEVLDIIKKNNSRKFSEPRQVLMWYERIYNGTKLKNIAHAFNRDHSTVVVNKQVLDDLMEDKKFKNKIKKLIGYEED